MLLLLLQLAAGAPAPPAQDTGFAALVQQLSEGGGYFDSDNLVSNETSYLHVMGALDALGVRGGAYIGVGPEQGFSYIARIRPEIAFIIDIRRDNLLLHLLFKAMFTTARNRLEYLCLLYGTPAPPDLAEWTELPLASLLEYLDTTVPDSGLHDRNHRALMRQVAGYGIPLSETDRETLRRFHDEFALYGLEVRYRSRDRPPRWGYPSARQLYMSLDLEGREASYLASEEAFRVVQDLQRRHRIVPVVGDLAGPRALRAIGEYVAERGLTVSALYASNVEFYLFRQGSFGRFVENVRTLPAGESSVLIRSYFGRGYPHPQAEPGHLSTQLLQTIPRFVALTRFPERTTYWEVVTEGLVNLRAPRRAPRRRGIPRPQSRPGRRSTGCAGRR
jgi:hypothetical protein